MKLLLQQKQKQQQSHEWMRRQGQGGRGPEPMCLLLTMVMMMLLILMLTKNVAARSAVGVEPGKKQKAGKDAALELTTATFNTSLRAAPTQFAIVQFYAHWCPACQNFKPQYETIAQLFNGMDAVYPGVLLVAKVDCAEAINRNLCKRFSVMRYPSLLWGKPASFAFGSRQEQDRSLEQIDFGMNAQSLLDWINTRLVASYSLDAAIQKKQSVHADEVISGQMVPSLHDIEEATAEALNIILDNQLVSSSHRAPFVHFVQLLAVHHPSRRCRAGSAQVLSNLMDAWPAEHLLELAQDSTGVESEALINLGDITALRQLHVCGDHLPHKKYETCSVVNGGYSCGLWYLFHSLSVRVDDSESKAALKVIFDFVANFFICEECRAHFSKLSEGAIDEVSSRRDLTLWLWRAHNKVNSRLAKQSWDQPTSKAQWPPKQMCKACTLSSRADQKGLYAEIDWNEDEVYKFLRKTYGQSILFGTDEALKMEAKPLDNSINSVEVRASSNAVTISVGAALGIAMAGCGFGVAAAFYWKVHQKNSKWWYVHRRV